MSIVLSWKLVDLRQLSENEIPALMKLGNDPLIRKHTGASFPSPYDITAAKKRIEHCKNNFGYGYEEFWIFVNDELVWCGGIQLGKGFEMKTMHVGYRIGAEHRNKGYATDFLKTIVNYAFEKYDILRIWSKVYSYNPASARVMEKVWFQREGIERSAVFFQWEIADAWIYGLIKHDWKGK